MALKKGARPGTEVRCKLLRTLTEKGFYTSELTAPMRGLPEQDKEKIAEKLLEIVQNSPDEQSAIEALSKLQEEE